MREKTHRHQQCVYASLKGESKDRGKEGRRREKLVILCLSRHFLSAFLWSPEITAGRGGHFVPGSLIRPEKGGLQTVSRASQPRVKRCNRNSQPVHTSSGHPSLCLRRTRCIIIRQGSSPGRIEYTGSSLVRGGRKRQRDEDKDEPIDQNEGSCESDEPKSAYSSTKTQNDGERWQRWSRSAETNDNDHFHSTRQGSRRSEWQSTREQNQGIEASGRSSCSCCQTPEGSVIIRHQSTAAPAICLITISDRDPGQGWRKCLVLHVTGQDLRNDAARHPPL